jgi:glyoxylase-like metal-dependent hydrolase (beta-lactamase superfamily II)
MITSIQEKKMTEAISIEVIEVGAFITNCYLVADRDKAIIIDPGDDARQIQSLIDKKKVNVEKIILTHGHIDHIRALPDIKNATDAPVYIHPDDAEMLVEAKANLSYYHDIAFATEPADGLLNEGDVFYVGSHEFKVIHTPGHTPGGISLLTDGLIFTGDALFWGSIGRTDFPGSDHNTLIRAIRDKLLILPPETRVFPGHGPQTTIGQEKTANPWLS